MTRRIATRHVAALVVYVAAALLFTWPLAIRITTHVPGDGIDDPALAWNLWWVKTRLVDQLHAGLFDTGWMFHPINVNLAFYTLTPLNGLISVPLQAAFPLTLVSNLILLSSFVLGAFGTYLLGLFLQSLPPLAGDKGDHTGDHTGDDHRRLATVIALVAGLIYAFASAKLFYAALGQFNIASSQWIPFAALYILRLGVSATPRAAMRNGAMAGLFIAFQAWAELTFASFLLILFAIYAVWWALTRLAAGAAAGAREQATPPAFVAGVGVAALVFVLGISPFLATMLPDLMAEGDFFASGGGFADVFSADLMGYLVPTRLHPVFGAFAAGLPFPNDKGQHIYLGYALFVVSLLGVYGYGIRWRSGRGNPVWFWAICAVVFWLLTLGPQLRWAGNELPIPGPFALVSRLPFFSGNRYPSRYSVMLLLSASALAVYGFRYVTLRPYARAGARTVRTAAVFVAGAAAVILFEHLSVPLPLNDFRVPPIYRQIAAGEGDFAVLELPTGWRNGARVLGRSDTLIMMQQWYQTAHGKRRLGGNTSRNPPLKFQYFSEAPLIGDLIALMNADREHIAAVVEEEYAALAADAQALAPPVLDFLGVKYVLLHLERAPDALVRFVEETLPVDLVDTWQGQDWTGAPATIRLYAVREAAAGQGWEIDLAAPEGRLHLAEGWSSLDAGDSAFRYATRPKSTLLLDLPETGGVLQMQLASIADSIDVRLNGRRLDSPPVGDTGQTEIAIPPGAAGDLVDRLEITWRGAPRPISEIGEPSQFPLLIGETGFSLEKGVSLAVRSAGEETGDFAHIYVNGHDYAPGDRGYNLVALTSGGDVLGARIFDTHASPEASAEMAAWLAQWLDGTIIAGAIADEGSHSLQEAAVDALAGLGVNGDMRGKFRWGHAFAGVVGAPAGTALEDAQLLRPAGISIGPPLDAPHATGGVGMIRFRAGD